jgi:hypothetical protein
MTVLNAKDFPVLENMLGGQILVFFFPFIFGAGDMVTAFD